MTDRDDSLQKVIVIAGPTASGKTDWALKLAKEFNGEIIAADSRQIYKKMTIGTAKPDGEWRWQASWNGLRRTYYVDDVPHHLIDIVDPGKRFTVAEFRDRAMKYIKMAHKNGRVPFVVGGTGLYISTLVNNLHIPRVAPNKQLRKSLEEKTCEQLMGLLENLDPEAAKTIDSHNKRRIIRALEVSILTGEPFSGQRKKGDQMFRFLQLGIDVPREVLYKRIDERVDKMVEKGLVKEIEALMQQKYSWDLSSMSGIGYRQFRSHFENKRSLEECIAHLKTDSHQYARRQMTWFKRDESIYWCKGFEEAHQLVQNFLA